MRILVGLVMVAGVGLAGAQQAGAQRVEATGWVTGHVSCADTNQAARMTNVTLQAVVEAGPLPVPAVAGGKAAAVNGSALSIYRTRLDGTFSIGKVKPGRYYVIVQKPGYLSPVAQFSKEEIERPTGDVKDAIAREIPQVLVTANGAANVEISLRRAGTIAGTMRFDDGSAAPGMYVGIQRKNAAGKWNWNYGGTNGRTDDLGRYRIAGLPAGEYRLSTNLYTDVHLTDAVFGGSSSSTSRSVYSLDFYFGDVFKKSEAKVVKISDGDEAAADFTIPVAKLHTVTGSLVDARTGRAINAGKVEL